MIDVKIRASQSEIQKQKKANGDTLCWKCERAGKPSCEWFADGKPVDGWQAIPTTVLMGGGRRERSFCVKSCPKFQPYHARGKCEIVRDW
jgi:hypothetical protein